MRVRCALGLLASALLLTAAAPAPLVVLREGARPGGIRDRTAPPVGAAAPEPRNFRSFPCEILPPGYRREIPRPLSALLPRIQRGAQAGVDTLRLCIIRVDFLSDRMGAQSTGDGHFDLRTGVSGVPVDPPPHDRAYVEAHAEALRRFYRAQSYRSLEIVPTVFPADPDGAYHLVDMADYGPWSVTQSDSIATKATRLVTDAFHAADLSGDIDFTRFDAFVMIHAGADFQGDIDRNSPYDIPSFTLTLDPADSVSVNGGARKIGRVLVLPESPSQDERLAALNGVFAHEFGHVLGLPDLYNIFNGVPQVGYWSLMDSGENITAVVEDPQSGQTFEADGIFPTSLDPWCRLQLFPEAAHLTPVGEDTSLTLDGILADPLQLYADIDPTEYYLIENRALDLDGNGFPFVVQDSTTGVFLGPGDDPDAAEPLGHLEYDAVLPGGGVLIWHIDDKIVIPGLATTGAVNYRTGLRGIAVEEADGIWDMGRFNYGRPEDPFYVGNNDRFAPGTIPGSEANDGSNSGIEILIKSPAQRFMDVEVHRRFARNGWPVPLVETPTATTTPKAMTLADLDGTGKSMVFSLEYRAAGDPTPTRGLAAVRTNGRPYDPLSDLLVQVPNRLQPALASSDTFRVGAADPPVGVVAGVDNSGQTFVWNGAGANGLPSVVQVPAQTPPVLWPRPTGAGWVVYAGLGSINALAGGTLVLSDTVAAVEGKLPTAGPVIFPESPGAPGSFTAAAFAGGTVVVIDLQGIASPAVERMSSDVRYLYAGWMGLHGTGRSWVAVTGDSAAVLDRDTAGRVSSWALPVDSVAVEPGFGDLDGDGRSELVLGGGDGTVAAVNGDGSPVLGWPRRVDGPVRDLKLADLDGDGTLDVLALDANGRFHGWSGRGKVLPGYPRALGPYTLVGSALEDVDGGSRGLTWFGATGEGALAAMRFPEAKTAAGDWRYAGGRPERWYFQPSPNDAQPLADAPALDRPLLVYPNPARGDGVEIRFLLDAGQAATLDIVNAAGRTLPHPDLDFRGGPQTGENSVRWTLNGVAPGLYFCRLARHGGGHSRVDLAKVVVLR